MTEQSIEVAVEAAPIPDLTTEPVDIEASPVLRAAAEAPLQAADGIASKPCEICNEPVDIGERHEILRAGGPVWRHDYHTEPI